MSNRSLYERHAAVCQTLAHPTRLEVIDRLRRGEQPVSQLVKSMGVGQANLSQHLAVMRQRGIVQARREGLNVYYRLTSPKITKACELMRQVLLEQLEAGGQLAQTARA